MYLVGHSIETYKPTINPSRSVNTKYDHLRRQLAHYYPKIRLLLEADARGVRQADVAILDRNRVGEPAEWLEYAGVRLVAAEPQPGGHVERDLMSAVGNHRPPRPAVLVQHVEDAQVLDQSIREGAIELEHVPIRSHPAVANQIACILHREEVLARRQGIGIDLAQSGLQLVVERVSRLLIPAQAIGRQRVAIGNGGLQIEATVGIDSQVRAVSVHHLQDG